MPRMKNKEAQRIVRKILARVSIPSMEADDVRLNDSMTIDLNIDSLAYMEMIIELENSLNVTFDNEYVMDGSHSRVHDLVDYLVAKLREEQGENSAG